MHNDASLNYYGYDGQLLWTIPGSVRTTPQFESTFYAYEGRVPDADPPRFTAEPG